MSSFRLGNRRLGRRRCLLAVLEPFEPRTLLTTYYVSPTGSDTATGTSAADAFKTVAKVNSLDLDGGDSVLFEGGQTFAAPAVSSTNQVSDSGFESGNFNSWTENFDATAGNSSITTTSSNVHGGTRALKVAGSTAGGRGQLLTSKLRSGKSYLMNLWAKVASGTGTARGGITFYSGASTVANAQFTIAATSYTKYTASIVAPASFDRADVWVTKDAGTSILYADDFSVNETFATLVFDASDSGTSANPVTIASYGTGRATLNAGDGYGLWAGNVGGFVVRDLVFSGTWDGLSATGTSVASGVVFNNKLDSDTKLNYIRVDDLDVSHFKWSGISFEGDNGKAGFNDVRVTNSSAHDNGDVGIHFNGEFDASSTQYSHANAYVGWCSAYNNGGLPNIGRNSGTGIIFGDVDGGMVERSLSWNNGQNCNYSGGGPIGIWAWDSNNITFQYNESYANKSGSGSLDGGGFDFDGGVTNSLIQYNYSHDNYGAGYLLYQFSGARAFGNNTVRYNISENDSRQGHYGGIYLGGGTAVANTSIFNNTIYLSATADTSIAGIKIVGVGASNRLRNNIVYTTGGVKLLDSNSAYATSSVLFQGNDWFAGGSATAIKWGSTTYSSLSSWRATAQEKNGSTSTGQSLDPQLTSAGGGGTIADAAALSTLGAYKLLSGSPLIDAGVNVSSFGVDPGPFDFFGSASVTNSISDIGAHEYAPDQPPPPPPPPPPAPPPSPNGTDGNDTFILRFDPTSGRSQLFVNTPAYGTPTITWAPGTYDYYSIAAYGGDDTLIVDMSSGNPLPSVALSFDGGGGGGDRVVMLPYGWAGGRADISAGSITPGGASGPRVFFTAVEGIDIAVTAASAPPAAAPFGGVSVFVAAGTTAFFDSPLQLDSLSIEGSATVAAGGGNTLYTRALDLSGDAQLDLNDNDLIVDYSSASPQGTWNGTAYTDLTGLIASGRHGRAWDGPGIVSSAARANNLMTTLGIDESADVLHLDTFQTGLYAGQTVDATAVIIKYTYAGDLNLDGHINVDDYGIVDFRRAIGSINYASGDINYDGLVNVDDIGLMDFIVPIQGDVL